MSKKSSNIKDASSMKYVIITGGVVSGLGKGITASSLGMLLKESGLNVTAIKIDPYLNIDAGTMSPYEHGEVFVLDDGGEVDLDLGNYERFLNITLSKDHNITTGKIYDYVLKKERKGAYLGKTVQMIPHVSNAIINWIKRVSRIPVDGHGSVPDVCIIELGGTVGDIESMVYLEALRQFKFKNDNNIYHIHVSLIPYINSSKEMKSKPTQHSLAQLRYAGLLPNAIALRSSVPIQKSIKKKVSLFSMVNIDDIINIYDVNNIYCVPNLLFKQGILKTVINSLNISKTNININPNLSLINELSNKLANNNNEVNIGIVGKYTGLKDSYLSVTKALLSAALSNDLKLNIIWIESSDLETPNERSSSPSISELDEDILTSESDINDDEKDYDKLHKNAWNKLKSVDGILIPGGFGDRGIEGKILAVNYARINKIPFLGICLGMQMAVIEYARNVCNIKNANSQEFNKNNLYTNVIIFMPEIDKNNFGGTMRLGLRECNIVNKNSITYYMYNKCNKIYERHRHRYEVNPKYINLLQSNGLLFIGKDKSNQRMEIIELDRNIHPYFVGTQFHPEFKSGPLRPSPLFNGFIQASGHLLDKNKSFINYFNNLSLNNNNNKRSNPYIDNALLNGIQTNIKKDKEIIEFAQNI